MDTQRTVKEIEEAIIEREGGWRRNICVPNVTAQSFLLDHEADLIVVNPSGYAHEFEIKRSFEDFRRDFRKDYGHGADWIYKFSYVIPESTLERAISFMRDEFGRTGDDRYIMPQVLAYDEELRFTISGGYEICPSHVKTGHKHHRRRMHLEEMLKLARLGTMRYWNLRTKTGLK